MSIGDVIVLSVIALIVIIAIRVLKKNKNSCSACAHADCCKVKNKEKCHVLENSGH